MIEEANRLLEELDSPAPQLPPPPSELDQAFPVRPQASSRYGASLPALAQRRSQQRANDVPFSRILVLVAVGTVPIVYGGLSVFGGMKDFPAGRPEVSPSPHQATDP